MEVSEKVFVDSNFFIALFSKADSLHTRARAIATDIDSRAVQLVISNLIFLETVTVLSQRRGRAMAKEAGVYLLSAPNVEIIHIDPSLQHETWVLFQHAGHKDISFVDCSTAVVMRSESISHILTFDVKDFKALQKHVRFSFF